MNEQLYRKAEDCHLAVSHWFGEHGAACQECGAEQIWVLPALEERSEHVTIFAQLAAEERAMGYEGNW